MLRDESHTTKLAWQNKRSLGKVYWQRDKAFPKTPMTKGTKRAASDVRPPKREGLADAGTSLFFGANAHEVGVYISSINPKTRLRRIAGFFSQNLEKTHGFASLVCSDR